MEEELFLEILDQNHLQEKSRKLCIDYYEAFQKTLTTCFSRHIYSLEKIEEYLYLETAPYPALSEIAGRLLIVTQKQYRKHIESFVRLLQTKPNFQTLLVRPDDKHFNLPPFSLWCKDNLWVLMFDNVKRTLHLGNEPIQPIPLKF